MKNKFLKTFQIKYVLLLVIAAMTYSCEERLNHDDDLPSTLNIIESVKIGKTTATIDNLSGVVDFVLPSETNLNAVVLDIQSAAGVIVTPATGTTVNLTTPLEVTAESGGKTRHYIINARVLPNQIAFINEAATLNDIVDGDVKTAALWARQTYGSNFVYIPFSGLTLNALSNVNVVFFYYNQVGSLDLPQGIIDKKSVLTQFVVEGGKLLTGGNANTYISAIGRDTSGLLTIKDSGVGGNNPDIWGIDGGVNLQNDQRSHPIYNITNVISTDINGYYPVINGGYKENHNFMWDLSPLLTPGNQLGQFAEFQRIYGGKVLATWSGVTDEAAAGIIEFLPNSVYKGTIIAIGIGGMEWKMNDNRVNPYDSNIRGIYGNAIDYLKTK